MKSFTKFLVCLGLAARYSTVQLASGFSCGPSKRWTPSSAATRRNPRSAIPTIDRLVWRSPSPSIQRAVTTLSRATAITPLHLSTDPSNESSKSLPFWLDPGTKGGVIVYTVLLFVIPVLLYNAVVSLGIADEISAGRWIGVGFTVFLSLAWVGTYVFRVATKDMTYARQLKDYENAVIAKRLEELDDDEIQALVEEVERDDF